MDDLADRLANRVQLTTDGHRVYLDAVERAFGSNVDYAMLVKLYGQERDKEATYSPAKVISCRSVCITGDPEPEHISTSYVERSNLSMRMAMRRFTRLTNAFSKKVENHIAALSLYFMYYNFCRVHQTLRVTPAMEAGISDHVWEIEEIVVARKKAAKIGEMAQRQAPRLMRNRKYARGFLIARSAIGHHHDRILDVVICRINFFMLGIEDNSRNHPQKSIRAGDLTYRKARLALARSPWAHSGAIVKQEALAVRIAHRHNPVCSVYGDAVERRIWVRDHPDGRYIRRSWFGGLTLLGCGLR